MRALLAAAALAASVLSAACDRDRGPAGDTARDTARAPAPARIEGTPAGGLTEWLGEIETGVASALDGMDAGWLDSQRRLLDLYVRRQEYIEMYWGPAGRLQAPGGEALAACVADLESAFHRLLQAYVAQPLDTTALRASRAQLEAEVQRVREAASGSGLTLVPPGG